jgi:hypothetical protein
LCTKIINDQLTDLFYNFIEMEDRIAANDRYADLNSSDMRFLSAVGKGVLGDDCLIDCSQIPMIYCNYDTQDVVDITLDDLQVGDEIILAIRGSEIENLQKEDSEHPACHQLHEEGRLTSWTNAESNAILSAVTGGATSRTIAGRSLTTE